MKFFEATDKYMETLFKIILSRTGYTGFFKAFVSLVTLFLITNHTLFEMTLKLEAESNKLKYVVEHELKKEIELDDFNCMFEMQSYPECKLAKYKYVQSTQGIELMELVSELLYKLMKITLGVSIIGFFANPFVHRAVP